MNPETTPRYRKLTRFMCHELLYEYERDELTVERRRDLEVYLAGDRESQRELDNLRKGAAYTARLAEISVAPRLASALAEFEPGWKTKMHKWTMWSSKRGWRALPYVMLVTASVLLTISWHPWTPERTQTLVEEKPAPPKLPAAPTAEPPAVAATAAVDPAATRLPASAPTAATSTAKVTPEGPAAVVAKESATPTKSSAPGRSELWRGTLTVADFGAAWPAVRAKALELGGKPAGAVELGWLRQPTESYFHMTLPENNYAALESYLKTLGPVRITHEHHPRVMPEGQIRIILTIKDNGTHEPEPAAESP